MTEDEYIEICADIAREEARDVIKNHLKPFALVKEYFLPKNMKTEDFKDFIKQTEESKTK